MTLCNFPVPVARVIIKDRRGRILLLRRMNDAHGEGRWCLPGGKIDYCQSPEEAAVREIAEETGLKISRPKFFFYQNSPPIKKGQMHCINFYFIARATGKAVLNKESSEGAWIEPKKAIAMEPIFGAIEALKRYCRAKGAGLISDYHPSIDSCNNYKKII